MKRQIYILSISDKSELKVIHQLNMLGVPNYISFNNIYILNKKCKKITNERIVYVFATQQELNRLKNLPFVLQITPCNNPPSDLPFEV